MAIHAFVANLHEALDMLPELALHPALFRQPYADQRERLIHIATCALPGVSRNPAPLQLRSDLRNRIEYEEKLTYVHENPLRKQLVSRPDDWPYQGRTHDLWWTSD